MPTIETVVVMMLLPPTHYCALSYPGHKKGCPNLGVKIGCPPSFRYQYVKNQVVRAVYIEFDLGEHVAHMKRLHPDWSERQLRCCLYWQPKARKMLRAEIGGAAADFSPEASGVDVTTTMQRVGVTLDWPPKNRVVLVAFMR